MQFLRDVWRLLLQFPEYLPGALAALTILVLGLPLYLGMWYFLHQRKLAFPWRLRIGCFSTFVLFAGLAFIFSTPLATKVPSIALNAYLFVACAMAAYAVVPLVDVFFIEYYLIGKRRIYISPPLHKAINFLVFFISFWPIVRYMMRFNPFARVALPTILTAGLALALQDTLKAFFAGIGLGQRLRVGDWMAFQDKEGHVLDINWGRTVVRTFQGDMLYIPNTLLLSQPFLNYSASGSHRLSLKVGVAASAHPEQVKQAMLRCTKEMPDILAFPVPAARIMAFENGFVEYGLFYSIENYGTRLDIQDKLATRVWDELQKEGFEVPQPFPTYTMNEGFHPVPRSPQPAGSKSST